MAESHITMQDECVLDEDSFVGRWFFAAKGLVASASSRSLSRVKRSASLARRQRLVRPCDQGYAARDVGSVYLKARKLYRQLGDTPDVSEVLHPAMDRAGINHGAAHMASTDYAIWPQAYCTSELMI